MSLILCLETATETCSVALSSNGHCIRELISSEDMSHSSELTPMIKKLLQQTEHTLQEISAVCLSNGPGSYTGLRVGSSTAKAICYSHKLPLISISSLRSLAFATIHEYHIDQNEILIPTIDARRMEVYMAIYSPDLNTISPTSNYIYTQESINRLVNDYPNRKIVICGHGTEKLKTSALEIPSAMRILAATSSAKNLCQLAFQKFQSQEFENIAYHKPQYYKAPHITSPKSKI